MSDLHVFLNKMDLIKLSLLCTSNTQNHNTHSLFDVTVIAIYQFVRQISQRPKVTREEDTSSDAQPGMLSTAE